MVKSNVNDINTHAFGEHTNQFKQVYEDGGAGTYIWNEDSWVKQGNNAQ